jgi:hypothetical protein
MAFTPTSRRMAGRTRRALSAGAAIALAAGAMLALAVPASAHSPKIEAACEEEVTTLQIKLINYNATGENSVSVVVDDEVLVDEVFETTFEQEWTDLDPKVAHVIEVDVSAWDDPDGAKGWSVSEQLEVEACAPAAPTTPPMPPSSSEVAPTSPAGGDSGGLAETGASIAIPIVLGLLLLVGGGALLLMVRRRGSANSANSGDSGNSTA